jgi:hypothetical protein
MFSWKTMTFLSDPKLLKGNVCVNSFKIVGNAIQVKLFERMPRVCTAVIKAKGSYFEESQI